MQCFIARFPKLLGPRNPDFLIFFTGPQSHVASIFAPNQHRKLMQNEKYTTLNNVLLQNIGTINGMDGIASLHKWSVLGFAKLYKLRITAVITCGRVHTARWICSTSAVPCYMYPLCSHKEGSPVVAWPQLGNPTLSYISFINVLYFGSDNSVAA